MTENSAIAQYLIQKSGKSHLLGKTIEDKTRIRHLECVLLDIRKVILDVVFVQSSHKELLEKEIAKGSTIQRKTDAPF